LTTKGIILKATHLCLTIILNTSTFILTSDKAPEANITVQINPIDPSNNTVAFTPEHLQLLKTRFPSNEFPKQAEVKIRCSGEFLEAEWTTDIGTTGYMKLPRSRSTLESDYVPEPVCDWSEFECYVRNLKHYEYIYRGQEQHWRLRTAFHRTGRAALIPYLNKDIPELHRSLTARTRHVFDLNSPIENGAFHNLVQHHGYPTPLLDWTYSPYVAAFFAYQRITNKQAREADQTKKVRIVIFNEKAWCEKFNQLQLLTVVRPHFSILKALAIENERSIPQQSLSSVTNIDDIEGYVKEREIESNGFKYLKVIDLPWGERPHVMRQLALMGITAGALFPGLDGACQELKERFFEV
jgi:hypothetical protein